MPFGIDTSGVDDIIGGGGGRAAFTKEFNTSDFDSFGGDVTSGKYTEIARFTIPSDTEYSWGYGAAKHSDNQGYLYIDLQNGVPAAVEGQIRFTVESSTGRSTEVVKDFDTERLDATKTDKQAMVPFPEQVNSDLATEDSHLVVEMNPNGDDTINMANSDVIIPVTEYDLTA